MAYRILALLLLMGIAAACSSETTSDTSLKTTEAPTTTERTKAPLNILVLGNSLTAGYGLDPDSAFPQLIQHKIDSLGLNYKVINAGLSGETTSGGLNRLDWLLRQSIDVLILELGANDGLRGIDPQATRGNLQQMIDMTRSKYPEVKIVLAGMKAPPNMGPQYTHEFEVVFEELAMSNGTALIPFLLDKVAGEQELNQPDGIHPTVEGHQIVARNVWEVLEPLL